jgi:putative chitinase
VIKLTLKSTLKSIKLNESTISMVLGAIVIIVVGLLVVNYFKGLDEGTTLPTGEQTEAVQGPTVTREGQTYHIVQANDNLWRIAERYFNSGYNWVDIASANNLNNPGFLSTGEELIIPKVVSRQPTVELASNSTLGNSTVNINPISGATYEVVTGDNLWDIAVRAYSDGYRWTDIARENNLENPSLIHPGNVLSLPR